MPLAFDRESWSGRIDYTPSGTSSRPLLSAMIAVGSNLCEFFLVALDAEKVVLDFLCSKNVSLCAV